MQSACIVVIVLVFRVFFTAAILWLISRVEVHVLFLQAVDDRAHPLEERAVLHLGVTLLPVGEGHGEL